MFGGFDIRPVLGSRSTDLKCHIGGLSGRALKAGDVLPVLRAFELPQETVSAARKARAGSRRDWKLWALGHAEPPHGFIGAQKFPLLRVVLGPQDRRRSPKGVSLPFKSALYTVAQDSNRMAAKLRRRGDRGPRRAWTSSRTASWRSWVGQFPQTAEPIAMRRPIDQSAGGYAKMATVIPRDIPGAGAGTAPARLVGFRVVSGGRGRGGLPEGKR